MLAKEQHSQQKRTRNNLNNTQEAWASFKNVCTTVLLNGLYSSSWNFTFCLLYCYETAGAIIAYCSLKQQLDVQYFVCYSSFIASQFFLKLILPRKKLCFSVFSSLIICSRFGLAISCFCYQQMCYGTVPIAACVKHFKVTSIFWNNNR